jgi:hypothetical protein
MAKDRKAGRIDALKANAGSKVKPDPRAKRTFRLDEKVARGFECHCIAKGKDKDKQLEAILVKYLAGSYWVDKTDEASQTTAPVAGDERPPAPVEKPHLAETG